VSICSTLYSKICVLVNDLMTCSVCIGRIPILDQAGKHISVAAFQEEEEAVEFASTQKIE
jgi:hypothetical protein